jgi:NAD(P)-dependent dehydrogenase (short-subunit alcohol dehydrogenase family)
MARSAVVTGSASGIGKATAALLAHNDVRVIGVDLRDAEVIADLATSEGRRQMVEGVRALAGDRIDAVFACAGVALPGAITLAVNYFGAVATLEGLRPLLARGNQPRAVATSSIAAISPLVDQALVEVCLRGDEEAALALAEGNKSEVTYHAGKAALIRWVRRMAIRPQWAGAGILLNVIAPGLIDTPMSRPLIESPAAMADLQETFPMQVGRYAQPEEVGQVLRFLGSPENSFMVGQVIFIDGGGEASYRGDQMW